MKKNNKNKKVSTTVLTVVSMTFILLGIFLCLSLSSFYFTGSSDRSFFECSFWDLLFDDDLVCSNIGGRYGAWISDLLINRFIGLCSFVVPFLSVLIGIRLFIPIPLFNIIVKSIIGTMWLSVVLGFLTYPYTDSQFPMWGGMYGYYMAKWLMSAFGVFGTVLLLLFTLFAWAVLTTEKCNDWYRSFIYKISNGRIKLSKILLLKDDKYQTELFYKDDEDEEVDEDDVDDSLEDEINEEKEVEREIEEDDVEEEEEKHEVSYIDNTKTLHDDDIDKEEEGEEDDNDGFSISKAIGDSEDVADVRGVINTPYDPTLDLEYYKMPSIELLNSDDSSEVEEVSESYLRENKTIIVETFKNFSIDISSIKATVGPTVTLYEIVPVKGTRISRIQGLENDIAMSLSALGIRIIAPIPGQGTVGIEVPNKKPQIVSMSSVLKSKKFQESKYELPVAMGKTISNDVFVFDLAKTPHLLVAGATGQGKSVGLNAIITSLLYKKHPSQVKFVMVDPKRVELSIYRKLEKHFMAKMPSENEIIITDVEKVKTTLNSLTVEMEDRYQLLQKVDLRSIKEYNDKFIHRKLNPEDGHRFLPYIVVIVDEFADLLMVVGKEIEKPIARIAQKARAVGIHMILATQRPSADVITGVIKANFPARIAFKVSAMQDSRTILDSSGAQNLIGRGDMLCNVDGSVTRVQCAYVSTEEVMAVSEYVASQQSYACAYELPDVEEDGDGNATSKTENNVGNFDSLLRDVAEFVVENNIGSASYIQRRFNTGFNRAGRLFDQLERIGVVGPLKGSKPRSVIVHDMETLQHILQEFNIK